ncbi:YlaC family protein [Erwinia sp.]|uniref:YlaC family protein n=1 Tax=Erwinia citreus TaxID=558 RepID=UPI003C71A7BD
MQDVKQILQREIETLNQQEQRDNRPRLSMTFLKNHPGLWISMYVCYALTVALIFTTEFLGWPAFWGATFFVLFMSGLMMLDVNPRYRFEDIDTLDLRVCYNGEWYYIRTLSDKAIQEILASSQVSDKVKQGIEKLLSLKGEVDFYDVYHLTWGQQRASTV